MTKPLPAEAIDDADDVLLLLDSISHRNIERIDVEMQHFRMTFVEDISGREYMLECTFPKGNLWLHDRDDKEVVWKNRRRR